MNKVKIKLFTLSKVDFQTNTNTWLKEDWQQKLKMLKRKQINSLRWKKYAYVTQDL